MKKILIILSLLFIPSAVLASGVGYINYDYVYKNLAISKSYQTKINSKVAQLRSYEKSTQAQVDAQKDLEKKSQIIKSRKDGLTKIQNEYLSLKEQQQKVVLEKVKIASDIVLAQKKLDIIINSKLRVSGGVDCTLDVMKAIK